jgi:predicted CXXCH cytochrome family protein
MESKNSCASLTASSLFAALLLLGMSSIASSEEAGCTKCHETLIKGKFLHPAVEMGCDACHSNLDASTVPHKKTNHIAFGLFDKQPGLCYGCHDKSMFTKKIIHHAIDMGCTGCHNPHSSDDSKLLRSKPPPLCFGCHDKTEFTKKDVHRPVGEGKCLLCHNPHSSKEMALLNKKPMETCLQCHRTIREKHISDFHEKKHPLGGKETAEGETALPQSPLKPGTPFYCGTCHNPHSTNTPLLFRFGAQTITELCKHCHKMD